MAPALSIVTSQIEVLGKTFCDDDPQKNRLPNPNRMEFGSKEAQNRRLITMSILYGVFIEIK